MIIVDILQALLDLQCAAPPDDGPGSSLRASTFSAIAAAFATQGYWVQADILDKLLSTHLQLWAPLVYIIAVIGGLIGVAIGSPPRNYMWFFMGPAIYSWLIGSQVEVRGVRWAMPCLNGNALEAFQSKVWELAEVGLANTNMARIIGPNNARITKSSEPIAKVRVSTVFLWYDELISSTVLNMSRWTGLYNLEPGQMADTNLPELPSSAGSAVPLGVLWSLYADLKWQALEEITAAGIDSPDFRDAFANFFVMCGDPLRESFRVEAMMAAAASKGRKLPLTVFNCGSNDSCGSLGRNYYEASGRLEDYLVELPVSLKNVVTTTLTQVGSWPMISEDIPADFMGPPAPVSSLEYLQRGTTINCKYYLFLIMQALRVEAALKYHGLWNSMVPELIPLGDIIPERRAREDMLISTLFYGWDIRSNRTWEDAVTVSSDGALLTLEERRQFAQNLILLHLFRNEYMLVKELAPVRQTAAEKNQYNVDLALKTTSAKSKFSEFYTWSLMLPYVQGTLLYFLAMAYPFACVLVVVPGWHKVIFTWMSFWAWAKMWDLGFAIVKALERSIWAMTSQGGNVKYLSDRVVSLDTHLGRNSWVDCTSNCPLIPQFKLVGDGGGEVNFAAPLSSNDGPMQAAWYLLDQGLLMSKSLNLDLANSYYIFIMAGLYMSIPAVTGQLVLGARAGAASMVNSMIGGTATDAGRAASSGVQGDLSMKLRSNAATVAQGSEAKAMAAQGFAAQALGYSVKGLEEGRAASEAQVGSSGIGRVLGQMQNSRDMAASQARAVTAAGGTILDGYKGFRGTPVNPGGADPDAVANGTSTGGPAPGGGPGGAKGAVLGGAGPAMSAAEAAYNATNASDYYNAHSRLSGQQAGLDIRGFEAGANGAQLKSAESNMRAYGDFSAKQAAWYDRNAFANQVGGWSAALGIQTGNVDPGPKPTEMVGMAMSGMLVRSNGQNAAGTHAWHLDWNNGSGHKAGTAQAVGSLTSNYGSNAIQSSYVGGIGGAWAMDHPLAKGENAASTGVGRMSPGASVGTLNPSSGSVEPLERK